jgi:GT2 family glycosyltransferase
MNGMDGELVVIIPTRDRPAYLTQTISALERQEHPADRIVIVDASDSERGEEVSATCARRLIPITVLKAHVPSLTGQRNQGIDHVLDTMRDVRIVQFMDDDVLPAPDYLGKVARILAADLSKSIGGVSGVTEHVSSRASARYEAFMRLFLLHGGRPGTMRASGINVPVSREAKELVEGDWLIGCSAYRVEVLRRLRFWEGQHGYVLFEDVEFSVRVARRWRLVVDPSARLWHAQASTHDQDLYLLARQFIRNRHHVVSRCLPTRGRHLAYWWSTLGYFLFWGTKAAAGHADAGPRLRGASHGVRDIIRGRS